MSDFPALTKYTRFSGCGAKLGPGVLEKALCGLRQPAYPQLIADFSGYEDAGLFRLSDNSALVQTVDFFPPIVDNPFLFGRIAAANALSDVYAMGGRPITALCLTCYPLKELGMDALKAMMEGGLDALIEAGCALLGGHSVEDPEPKLGYAVTGLVDPAKAWCNNTLQPGAALILTKPIGTGLVNMAQRADCADPKAVGIAHASMATLNKTAAEVLSTFAVLACTDVTGFGLAGHAAEMVDSAPCGVRIRYADLPLIPGAADYASMGLVPEGTFRNKQGRMRFVTNAASIDPVALDIIFDPQTSGGLLVAVPQGQAEAALSALKARGVPAALIGETGGETGTVEILL
jgi:selenide,water dikinase